MPQHWTEKHKHKAKDAFDQAPKQSVEVEQSQPKAPQPQLTPNGPMRSNVDAQIREQTAAKRARIEQRRKQIEAKLERDRIKDRALER